jgi:putative transposase
VVLIDQTAVQRRPVRRRGYAPKGQRPCLRAPKSYEKLSVMGALCVPPKNQPFQLHFESLTNASYNAVKIVLFLNELLTQIAGPILVVWDNAPIHRSKLVRQFLKDHPRVTLEFLPPYAPELNPVETMWSYLKYHLMANVIAKDMHDLEDRVTNNLMDLKFDQALMESFFKNTKLYDVIKNLAA